MEPVELKQICICRIEFGVAFLVSRRRI